MFHSNQELKISGDFGHRNDFIESLKFALAKSGYMEYFTRSNKPCQCAFQVSANKDAYYKGFLIEEAERWAYDKDVGLKKAHHAVIKITPFTCYYSK